MPWSVEITETSDQGKLAKSKGASSVETKNSRCQNPPGLWTWKTLITFITSPIPPPSEKRHTNKNPAGNVANQPTNQPPPTPLPGLLVLFSLSIFPGKFNCIERIGLEETNICLCLRTPTRSRDFLAIRPRSSYPWRIHGTGIFTQSSMALRKSTWNNTLIGWTSHFQFRKCWLSLLPLVGWLLVVEAEMTQMVMNPMINTWFIESHRIHGISTKFYQYWKKNKFNHPCR